jgi:hypothetical protein
VDIVESGGGNGRFFAIAGVIGVAAVVAAFAGVVLFAGGGGDDDEPTPTPTQDTRPALAPGKYDYNLRVTESTCSFGLRPGDLYSLSFLYEAVGGGSDLREGDQVEIIGVLPDGNRVPLGRQTLSLENFVFSYPVEAGETRGTAELSTTFADRSTIASAALTETYDTAEGQCSISATQ